MNIFVCQCCHCDVSAQLILFTPNIGLTFVYQNWQLKLFTPTHQNCADWKLPCILWLVISILVFIKFCMVCSQFLLHNFSLLSTFGSWHLSFRSLKCIFRFITVIEKKNNKLSSTKMDNDFLPCVEGSTSCQFTAKCPVNLLYSVTLSVVNRQKVTFDTFVRSTCVRRTCFSPAHCCQFQQ